MPAKNGTSADFSEFGSRIAWSYWPAQGLADAPTRRQFQRAVAEREAQGLAHFRHALKDRPAPLGGQHVDFALRVALLETLKQCLRHHHVTDPTGPNDQNIHVVSINEPGRHLRLPASIITVGTPAACDGSLPST
jgi:hypothetical protein